MRTEGDFIKINEWLLPLSWLYGIGVRLRNWMFDIGVLKSQTLYSHYCCGQYYGGWLG